MLIATRSIYLSVRSWGIAGYIHDETGVPSTERLRNIEATFAQSTPFIVVFDILEVEKCIMPETIQDNHEFFRENVEWRKTSSPVLPLLNSCGFIQILL